MTGLTVKPLTPDGYHIVSLGGATKKETPLDGLPYSSARGALWDFSGGEFNVATNLATLDPTSLRAAHVTSLPRNKEGLWCYKEGRWKCVDMLVKWLDHDGLYGPNIAHTQTFPGSGCIPATVEYMRANEAAASLSKDDLPMLEALLKKGVGFLHSGGIFASLSKGCTEFVIESFDLALSLDTITTFDVNIRPKMWDGAKRQGEMCEVYHELAKRTRVLCGNVDDFSGGFGIETDSSLPAKEAFAKVAAELIERYPNIELVGRNLRREIDSNHHHWSGMIFYQGEVYEAHPEIDPWPQIFVVDRTGGGDGFGAGILYGILKGLSPEEIVRTAVALGACVAATPGDTSHAQLAEVMKAVKGSMEIDR